jgi:heterodisulfide reductase subunit C
MVNFGYTPLSVNIHDLDKADLKLADSISEEEPSFMLCIACGSCTATCTAGSFTNFSFRQLCHQIRRGESKMAIDESEKCMMCGKCTLACPRNVNTRNIIRLVRKAKQTL